MQATSIQGAPQVAFWNIDAVHGGLERAATTAIQVQEPDKDSQAQFLSGPLANKRLWQFQIREREILAQLRGS